MISVVLNVLFDSTRAGGTDRGEATWHCLTIMRSSWGHYNVIMMSLRGPSFTMMYIVHCDVIMRSIWFELLLNDYDVMMGSSWGLCRITTSRLLRCHCEVAMRSLRSVKQIGFPVFTWSPWAHSFFHHVLSSSLLLPLSSLCPTLLATQCHHLIICTMW